MTHLALHHVVVRMLYDPAFVQSVFARPEEALADAGITTEDIDWLLQTDPRAYTTDSHRRARSLGGLLEEYPTSCAALVRARHRSDAGTPPVAVLDAFFSSAGFHRGMQAGASLALSFGEYLVQTADGLPRADPAATLRHELAAALARIELRIARLRRIALRSLPAIPEWTDSADSSELERARLHASPCIDWLTVPEGVLDRFGEVRRQLALASSARPSVEAADDTDDGGSVGVGVGVGTDSAPAGAGDARTAVVDPRVPLTLDLAAPDTLGAVRQETILFTAQLDSPVAPGGWLRVIDVQLAAISEELGGVLDATRHGVAGADLIDQVLEMGVGHDDAREILRDLVNDRLLIVGAPDSTASSSS